MRLPNKQEIKKGIIYGSFVAVPVGVWYYLNKNTVDAKLLEAKIATQNKVVEKERVFTTKNVSDVKAKLVLSNPIRNDRRIKLAFRR